MISVIIPIKYGDNERSRLSGIGLGIGVIDFQGYHQRGYNVMCRKRKTLIVILSGC